MYTDRNKSVTSKQTQMHGHRPQRNGAKNKQYAFVMFSSIVRVVLLTSSCTKIVHDVISYAKNIVVVGEVALSMCVVVAVAVVVGEVVRCRCCCSVNQ